MATLTDAQTEKLQILCDRYKVEFHPDDYQPAFDLPDGWVAGWVGGPLHAGVESAGFNVKTIYVGVSPEGDSHS